MPIPKMEEEALVVYPVPFVSHLVPITELCKHIVTHMPSLSIHIFIATTPPFNTTTISHYTTTISSTIPSITFHNLPTLTTLSSTLDPTTLLFEILRLNAQHLHESLLSLSKSHIVKALIMDFFCFHAFTLATQLNIPSYYFFTCSASSLSSFFYLPTIHHTIDKSLRELNNTCLHIPGVPPMPCGDMPEPLLERGSKPYQSFLQSSLQAPKLAGVIVNTFEALEPRSVKAISDGFCIPNDPTPPIYCVGPLVASKTELGGVNDEYCLSWLNSQPSKSVVFLCFGSLGLFPREQLCEMACGLERSGQRYWTKIIVFHPNMLP